MALPVTIPNTFAGATSAIPLSQLDNNFTTVVNGINGIGNGTNSLANVSITGGNITTLTTALTVPNGGTGLTTITSNNVVLGNGTGSVQVVAPGTSGYMLVSNGTTWSSNNTITSTILSAPTINDGYTEETVTANTSTAYTISLSNGTFQILTLTGNCSFTFPTATAGQSFMMFLKQDATGSRTVTWPAAVKWPSSTAPTITATASKGDKFVFTADGTNWLGSTAGQNYL